MVYFIGQSYASLSERFLRSPAGLVGLLGCKKWTVNEYDFPIERGDIPASYVSLPEVMHFSLLL